MSHSAVTEDWSQFNTAVLKRAGQAQPGAPWKGRAAVAAAATAAVGLALTAVFWPKAQEYDSVPFAEPAPAPTLRIDPVDLDRLTIRIHPDDLARLEAARGAAPSAFPNLPSPPEVQPPASPGEPPVKVVTNYTLFHNVEIGGGMGVSTGWRYESSGDTSPSFQYCYLRLPILPGAPRRSVELADTIDGRVPFASTPDTVNRPLYDEAMSRCVWFPGTRLP